MPIRNIKKKAAKIKAKLTKNGTAFTIRGKGTVYGFFSNIDHSKIPATLVDVVDTAIVIEPTHTPTVNDYVLYGNEKFKVVAVNNVRPDGTVLMYELLLRS